jgi:hypothetical protein
MATAGFSYEADIAPLRGESFGAVTSTGLERERMLDRESALRIAKIQANSRSQEIAFKQQQMQLERVAEEARLEREALTAVPTITQQLTSILDDPTKDDATKAAEAARLKLQNTGLATNSKTVSNLFTSFENEIQSKKAEQDRTNALASILAQTGQADAVRKIFEGKTNPMANEYITAADSIAAAKKEEKDLLNKSGVAKEIAKREAAASAAALTARTTLMTDYMSTLRKLAPPKEDETGVQIGTLSGDKTKQPTIPQAKPFKFSQNDKIELEEMALTFGVPQEEISKLSDTDLYRLNLRATTSALRDISGFGSGGDAQSGFGFPASRFSSKPPQ